MAYYHPQVVHFAIALLVVGVVLRLISLAGRPAFVAPAALTLLAVGTIAATLAVQSGTAAHGPVERIPGVRPAVVAHEAWGIHAQHVFHRHRDRGGGPDSVAAGAPSSGVCGLGGGRARRALLPVRSRRAWRRAGLRVCRRRWHPQRRSRRRRAA